MCHWSCRWRTSHFGKRSPRLPDRCALSVVGMCVCARCGRSITRVPIRSSELNFMGRLLPNESLAEIGPGLARKEHRGRKSAWKVSSARASQIKDRTENYAHSLTLEEKVKMS